MKIIIFGAGGFAKEIIDLIEDNIEGDILGYIDKVESHKKILDCPRLGSDQHLNQIIKKYKPSHFFAAIGDSKIRSKLYSNLKSKLSPLSIISKKAHISKYTKIGNHVAVYPYAVISTQVSIGNNTFVYSNSFVGHESKIGNHVNINPGVSIAGKVIIEDFVTVGIGASVKEKLHISKSTTIGGGAMVVKDTKLNNI